MQVEEAEEDVKKVYKPLSKRERMFLKAKRRRERENKDLE